MPVALRQSGKAIRPRPALGDCFISVKRRAAIFRLPCFRLCRKTCRAAVYIDCAVTGMHFFTIRPDGPFHRILTASAQRAACVRSAYICRFTRTFPSPRNRSHKSRGVREPARLESSFGEGKHRSFLSLNELFRYYPSSDFISPELSDAEKSRNGFRDTPRTVTHLSRAMSPFRSRAEKMYRPKKGPPRA